MLAQGEIVDIVDAATATPPGGDADDRRTVKGERPLAVRLPADSGLGPLCCARNRRDLHQLAGGNPWAAYWAVAHGAFGDVFGFGATLTKMAPILLAGLGVALAARVGLFNIGAEGQIYLGGLGRRGWDSTFPACRPLHIPWRSRPVASRAGSGRCCRPTCASPGA